MEYLAPLALLVVVPLWRICARAGLNPALSLVAIIPFLGVPIVAALLSFREWHQVSTNSQGQ
jgi:hypothetical protein